MASSSSKNRTRSLTLEDDEDEEAHRKEETDLNEEQELDEEYDHDRAELNKEAEMDEVAKHEEEANDDNIVASESAISEAQKKKKMESEDKDANQEDESSLPINRNRGGPSTIRTAPRRATPEKEKEIVKATIALSRMKSFGNATLAMNQPNMASEKETDEDDDHEEADEDYDVNQEEEDDEYLKKLKAPAVEREQSKTRKMETKDDSEQTMSLLRRWETPRIPPDAIVCRSLIDQCSRPIRKQLTKRDVKQSRLALAKVQVRKKFLHLLEKGKILRGKEGVRVPVYGPDGKVHEMTMLSDEKNFHDLTTGWSKFVGDYELKEYCDFVTIWMFRHRLTQQICLAIDSKRLVFRKQVSKRISKAAFEDSD